MNTGDFTVWNQDNTDISEIARAAITSSSIPAVFPPHHWEERGLFMDGGTVYNVNMTSAIEQCLEIVDDESKITIDLMVCHTSRLAEAETDVGSKTLSHMLRARHIRKGYGSINEIQHTMRAHPNINYRYLIYESPDQHMGGVHELEFDGDKTWPAQLQGRQDAQDTLNAGEGTGFRSLLEGNAYILQ